MKSSGLVFGYENIICVVIFLPLICYYTGTGTCAPWVQIKFQIHLSYKRVPDCGDLTYLYKSRPLVTRDSSQTCTDGWSLSVRFVTKRKGVHFFPSGSEVTLPVTCSVTGSCLSRPNPGTTNRIVLFSNYLLWKI